MKTAALIVALAGILTAVVWWAVSSVTAVGGFHMPLVGWLAMIVGILVAVGVGVGLMALVFHSHRRGYDGPPSAGPGFVHVADAPPNDTPGPSSAGD
jgi:cation transporter-like permease